MDNCFENFRVELQSQSPKIVFLLGRLVSDFIFEKFDLVKVDLKNGFKYRVAEAEGIKFVAVHHPSYILVYKRKQIKKYISEIHKLIETAA